MSYCPIHQATVSFDGSTWDCPDCTALRKERVEELIERMSKHIQPPSELPTFANVMRKMREIDELAPRIAMRPEDADWAAETAKRYGFKVISSDLVKPGMIYFMAPPPAPGTIGS